MIGIIIVSHGKLGQGLIESAEIILGRKKNIVALPLSGETELIEQMRNKLVEEIDKIDEGQGVVLLTDLFGGTPCNLSLSILGVRRIEIIAGVNLPIVLKLLTVRDSYPNIDLNDACILAEKSGKKQISIASHLIAS
ncbi:MAG: PTS sugar transporter subunit IIA [Holosporales bacterium]|jgi:PTS system mannose-specific IIA component|nr:PTS sugar transporter subunit IIA [Holosporales bacterium]